jgi:hypothetical protein
MIDVLRRIGPALSLELLAGQTAGQIAQCFELELADVPD